MTKFSFIDLFAGIGGFRLGLEPLGGECKFSCEINQWACKTYKEWFGDDPSCDIRQLEPTRIPDHDVLTGGFPCISFSLAGKKKGFQDDISGDLFFHLANIIYIKRPKILFLENVKNLISHNRGLTWKIIYNILQNEIGYHLCFKVIDAKVVVPQHRERIFIVGFDKKLFKDFTFKFPDFHKESPQLRSILENEVNSKYTLSDKLWHYLQRHAQKHKDLGNGFGFGLVDPYGISRTLSARYYKDGSEILIPQEGKNPRRLIPRECARLMGFPDHLPIVVSDTQAYKQFGNAVVPLLVTKIGESICHLLN